MGDAATTPQPSAKALGKRRMVDVVDAPQHTPAQAALLTQIACAPATEPPMPSAERPAPDCRDDEAIAAMYQAQYDREVRETLERERQAQQDAEADAAYDELFGSPDAVEHGLGDLGNLSMEQQQSYCVQYQQETDYLKQMLADLENSKKLDAMPVGYGYSDDEQEPHSIFPSELDALPPNTVIGVPVAPVSSHYFSSCSMFQPLAPSPTKPPTKKYRGPIKMDPEEDEQ
jgi:hypothetical protein